jgi:hypothetical protein
LHSKPDAQGTATSMLQASAVAMLRASPKHMLGDAIGRGRGRGIYKPAPMTERCKVPWGALEKLMSALTVTVVGREMRKPEF